MLNTINFDGFRLTVYNENLPYDCNLSNFAINHSSMTVFAISEVMIIPQPEVDKHLQFFLQVQLWKMVNISGASHFAYSYFAYFPFCPGWLGWAMVLGSFQCWGILLILQIVGQGPAVLAVGAGRVGYILYIFHLSSLSKILSFGRWLNMTEILWFRLLNPNGSCQLLPRTSSLSTG